MRIRLPLNLLLALAALLASLLLGEVGLRIGKPRGVMIQRQPTIYQRDEVIGSRYAPNAAGLMHRGFEIDNLVRTNSLGFHDLEHDFADGALHVAAIGDSFTAAFEVPPEAGWTRLLQQRLRDAGHAGAEVVNLGMDHSGTDVHLEILKRYLALGRVPDVVVLAFYENDIEDMQRRRFFRETVEERYVIVYSNAKQREKILGRIAERAPGPAATWVLDHVLTCRLVRSFFTGEDDPYFNNLVGIKGRKGKSPDGGKAAMTRSVDELLRLSADHGFRLLTVPVPPKWEPNGSIRPLRNALTPERFAAIGLVNPTPAVSRILAEEGQPREAMYWELDAHFNGYGNRVFARVVFEALALPAAGEGER
jgi:hypothetical protein